MLRIFKNLFVLLLIAFPVAAVAQEAAAVVEPSIGDLLLRDVVPQLVALLGAALGILIVFLRTKTGKWISAKAGNDALGSALQWASALAFDLVMAAVQTEVTTLKTQLTDGKISKEEYAKQLGAIKAAVLTKLRDATMGRLLGSGMTSAAAMTITDDLVESAVAKSKAAGNP